MLPVIPQVALTTIDDGRIVGYGVPTYTSKNRVFDNATLFSPSELEAIVVAVEKFREETGFDFVVYTTNKDFGELSDHEIARSFYRDNGYGTGAYNSAVLYHINMHRRYEYLYTNGYMIDYMTDRRIELALDKSNPFLRIGEYANGVLAMINAVQAFVENGIPEEQYRYDTQTGEKLPSD